MGLRTYGKLNAMRVSDATSTLNRRVRKVESALTTHRTVYRGQSEREKFTAGPREGERRAGLAHPNSSLTPYPNKLRSKESRTPLFFSTVSGVFLQRSSPTVGSEHHGCLRSDSVHSFPGFTAGNYRKVRSPFQKHHFSPKNNVTFLTPAMPTWPWRSLTGLPHPTAERTGRRCSNCQRTGSPR